MIKLSGFIAYPSLPKNPWFGFAFGCPGACIIKTSKAENTKTLAVFCGINSCTRISVSSHVNILVIFKKHGTRPRTDGNSLGCRRHHIESPYAQMESRRHTGPSPIPIPMSFFRIWLNTFAVYLWHNNLQEPTLKRMIVSFLPVISPLLSITSLSQLLWHAITTDTDICFV